jgi:PKD repeat protein
MHKTMAGVLALVMLGAAMLPAAGLGAGPRAAPVADAGKDQTAFINATVYFDGSGSSDSDGDTLTYSWDFDRSNGIQRDATGVNVSHVYATAGVFRVTLTVSDGTQFDTDECNVTVRSAGNNPPTAVISEPRNGAVKQVSTPVQFDGSNSSDPDKDPLAFSWDFGDGGTSHAAKPAHTYKDTGLMTVILNVSDGKLSDSATVYINIVAVPGVGIDHPPNADAGSNKTDVYVKQTIYFSSASTDQDGDTLKFFWDFDQSDGVNVLNPDAASNERTVTWVYNTSDNYTVTHWVQETNTTEHFVAFDTCWANVSDTPKYPPLAEAGPNQTVTVDTEVTLSGSGISRNQGGSIREFAWDFENDGVIDWTSNSTGKTKNTYTTVRVYTARLRVTDEVGAQAEDSTTITVNDKPNRPPEAIAGGDQAVFAGQSATFHGTGTDPDGQVVKYQWDFEGDGVWDFESPSSGTASHTYSAPGTYDSRFRVTDDRGATADDVSVVSVKLNQAPVADAGGDQNVNCGETVQFDGSASRDPDGQKISFSWNFGDGASDQTDATGASAEHIYTKGGEYTATLTVTDELGKSSRDTVIITVTQTAGATLKAAPSQKSLKPGEEGVFYLTLQNTGNGQDSFSLLLSGDNSRWGSLDQSLVPLEGSSSATLTLRVSPPVDAAAGAQAKVTVRATSAYDVATGASATVTVTAAQVYGVTVSPDVTNLSAESGRTASFTVRVTNTGNGDDRVSVKLAGAAAKWASASPAQSVLGRGLVKTVTVKLSIPADASAQDYMLTATALSQDNLTQSSAGIIVTVKKGPATGFLPGLEGPMLLAALASIAAAATVLGRRKR